MLQGRDSLITVFNKNIKLYEEIPLVESDKVFHRYSITDLQINYPLLGFSKKRIQIRDIWFDIIPLLELARKQSEDGYFRVVYIQLNTKSGEYYIGKANRKKLRELLRYTGSGTKFKSKYKNHKDEYVRYYIGSCDTAEETERLESLIVDTELLSDVKCLNLVSGGGGIAPPQSSRATSDKKRQHMLTHPEQYQPMLKASEALFQSGDTSALRVRNKAIKQTMESNFYRELSRERIKKWRKSKPDEYANSRQKNLESIRSPEVQEKRVQTLKENRKANPEQYQKAEAKRIAACKSPEANAKRKESLKKFKEENPEKAQANAQRRAKAAAAKTSKAVCMLDLETKEVLQTFASQQEAARWLVEEGIAKNTNCVSSIGAVCLRKKCTTGYGYRKKAYGYDWRFRADIEPNNS